MSFKIELIVKPLKKMVSSMFVGLGYQCKDIIVFRFIIEYSSLKDFGPR
jgi:hypothetical protein